jgi:hypothetical protein
VPLSGACGIRKSEALVPVYDLEIPTRGVLEKEAMAWRGSKGGTCLLKVRTFFQSTSASNKSSALLLLLVLLHV